MDNVISKNMTEAQANEIAELMNGEHAETIKMFGEENFRAGRGTGAIGGLMYAGLGAFCACIAVRAVRATWEIGKAFVHFVNGDES